MRKMRNAGRRIISVIAAVMLIITGSTALSLFHTTEVKAEGPRAWICSAITGETTNLRVSQLLECRTEGFDENCELKYSWYNGVTLDTFFGLFDWGWYQAGRDFRHAISLPISYKETTSPEPYFKYYVIPFDGARSGKIECTVTGTVNGVETSVKASYKGFKKSNLSQDICSNNYSLMVEETLDGKALLSAGGVAHVECDNAQINTFRAQQGGGDTIEVSGTDVKGLKEGYAQLYIKMTKTSGCSYHSGQVGTGTISLWVFPKMTFTPHCESIDINNTNPNYKYTVNGVTKQGNGGKLTFTGLYEDNTYEVEQSYDTVIDGVNRHFYNCGSVTTLKSFLVGIEVVGHGEVTDAGGARISEARIIKDTPLTAGIDAEAKAGEGYLFKGWASDAAGTHMLNKNASSGDIISSVTSASTVYAIFEELRYTAKLTMKDDSQTLAGHKVSLYQKGTEKYALKESSSDPGVYMSDPTSVLAGTYDIYLDGVSTEREWEIKSQSTNNFPQEYTIQYYTLSVNAKYEDTPYITGILDLFYKKDKSDVIEKEYKVASLEGDGTGKYFARIMAATDPNCGNDYLLYSDDKSLGMWIDLSSTHELNLDFYDINASLTKDDMPWSDAVVTAKGKTYGNEYPLEYTTEGYSAQKVLKDKYELIFTGVASPSDSKVSIQAESGNEVLLDESGCGAVNTSNNTLDFYTRSFYNGVSVMGKPFAPQVIEKGFAVNKPSTTPSKAGAGFMGWVTEDGLTTEDELAAKAFDFTKAVTSPEKVYSAWKGASVIIGKYEKESGKYTMPNLTINGYDTITAAKINIVKGGSIVSADALDDVTIRYSNANQMVFVTFPGENGVSVDVAQAYLRSNVIVTPSGESDTGIHSLEVTVYGETKK